MVSSLKGERSPQNLNFQEDLVMSSPSQESHISNPSISPKDDGLLASEKEDSAKHANASESSNQDVISSAEVSTSIFLKFKANRKRKSE